MRRILALVSVAVGLAGCGPVCNHDNVCAVDGRPPDVRVCDGSDFRSCGNGNRGQIISCVHTAQQAVCSLDGWAFENADQPDGG